ncbi:NAD(P)/FAD-dependent oxidoreductase [Mucilaginibacter lutimaris]|uniref:NADH:ubiquinone reductase (non-electrogenic) n=1 Tax=Mucilaginibacter lutimaris TaxID=931629 RepID=A0ABW2ZL24_9SPHI
MSDLSNPAQVGYNPVGAKKVVVIGGGFAGVNFAQNVAKNKNYQVTLVDKNNYNYFPPLLYQVSTSFLEPSSISYPFRKLFRKDNIRFRMGEPVKVDPASKIVYLKDGELTYDYLVFASGAKTNFFGNTNIEQNAIPMKSIDDGLRMRNALLQTLERATITKDPAERKKLLTIVVAGGGPTGVEVSGMLAEMKKYIFAKDYPELINQPGGIYIVDGGSELLGAMSEKTHQEAYKVLTGLGVKVKLNLHVNDFVDGKILLSNGEVIESNTLIWAAGITANTFEGIPVTSLGIGRRMITDEHNKVQGLEDVYAIGDASIQTTDGAYPKGHPQIAQVAIQQGKTLAANFIAMAKARPLKPFKYFDKGDMAIIGRNSAVVDLFKHKVHFGGIIALFMWLFIHLISLVNYRNKLRTLYNWAVAYLSRDQSFRMIFKSGV